MKEVIGYTKRAAACALLMLMFQGSARADFYYYFDNTWSGTSPAGSAPWISALFQDVGAGTVKLTLSNSGLTGTEYVNSLFFNLNPALNPSQLSFTELSGTAGVTAPTISTGEDAFKAGGDGNYDVEFSFATANAGRFGVSDTLTYQITGIPSLTAMDFGYLSSPAGGNGPFLSSAHIASIGANGAGSGWDNPSKITPVPEPAASFLVLAAAGLWLGVRRRPRGV
jgi:hypothetical protein